MKLSPLALAVLVAPCALGAQWSNRYPKNVGFNHHVYLEGYELPIMANGALDVAASSTGGLVIASRGWLWRLDATSGVATRLTSSGGVDSRPSWSPDGRRIAFLRDDSRTLAVMVRDMESGVETEVDRGMALDPVFSADGKSVVYANATSGDLDLWSADLSTGAKTRLTSEAGLELRPQLLPDGQGIVYTSKTRGGGDQIRLRQLPSGEESVLLQGSIISQTRPALSPDGKLLVYNWPGTLGWELRLMSTERPGVSVLLVAKPRGRPVAPAWSADGSTIYFSEADAQQVMRLYAVPANGGRVSPVAVGEWEWGVPTGRLSVRTTCAECAGPVAARLGVLDANGHPLAPSLGMSRFDGQTGQMYFYSPGVVELEVPAGPVVIRGVRGLTTTERVLRATVAAGESRAVSLDLPELWNARRAGYYSGDHHFHLNYGGQFDLAPQELLPLMAGEGLDVATPLLANLHNRFENQGHFDWRSLGSAPLVRWGQEVRSHFLGHVGLIGTDQLFWPWVWGPGYEVYGRDDRLNATALQFAREQGGAGIYVHPVSTPTPFTEAGLASLPIELVADAAMGMVDLLEVVCLWSNAVGATELWYRFLNAGLPVAPSAGTDAMTDFHRTMALGTTRVYVRPEGSFNFGSYMSALTAGRSFVTTGPMLELTVNGAAHPGDVVRVSGGRVKFALRAASAVAVDSVAIVVNGRTVRALGGLAAGTSGEWSGEVAVPRGGWIAARAIGPSTATWPAMAEYAFAHTAPVWLGESASTDPAARRAAAQDLLRALAVAEQRLVAGYEGSEIPRLRAHFAEARTRLQHMAQ
ncbi:MAG: CehA/McbA family metallohydrolase [Gemmatimonadaceae bacterium]